MRAGSYLPTQRGTSSASLRAAAPDRRPHTAADLLPVACPVVTSMGCRNAVAADDDRLYSSLALATCSTLQRCTTRIICTFLPRLVASASLRCTGLSFLAPISRLRLPRSWPGGCWICDRA